MIKNEEYMDYLSKVISCVSQGDYYSVKELSVLKLDNLKKETKMMEQKMEKFIKTNKCKKELKKLKEQEIIYFVNTYVDYLYNELKKSKKLNEIASIEEFFQEIK